MELNDLPVSGEFLFILRSHNVFVFLFPEKTLSDPGIEFLDPLDINTDLIIGSAKQYIVTGMRDIEKETIYILI